MRDTICASSNKEHCIDSDIWERIWEMGPIGNSLRHEIAEKLLFQMLQTILKYSW